MFTFISLILYVGWGALTFFMPELVYGLSWKDLITIAQDKDAETISKLLQSLGITDTNVKQEALQRIFICIGIAIAILIAIFVVMKLIKKYILKSGSVTKVVEKTTEGGTVTTKTTTKDSEFKRPIPFAAFIPLIIIIVLVIAGILMSV